MLDLVGNPEDCFFTTRLISFPQTNLSAHLQGVQRRMVLVVNFFVFLRLSFFCLIVAMCDLVHNVEAIHDLC